MSMQKKIFLFITDTQYKDGKLTGAHKRFVELIKGVCRTNDVVLISREIPELEGYSLRQIKIEEKKKTFLPAHIYRIITISKILRKEKKNIQYDYAISFGPVDTFCYGINGYNNITTLFREDFIGYKRVIGVSEIKMLYFKFLEKYAVKHSQKIIVQCEDDKKALMRRYGRKFNNLKKKIYVQINNVNTSWYLKSEKHKVNNGDIVNIAFVGNFSDNRKGHHLLLPAIAKLIDDGYNIRINIAGDGKQLDSYKNKYKEYKDMVFCGRVKDMAKLLAESDFEIAPSLMDSCPNTVLEGINAGIAVYGTNVGGIKDILKDREYLFELSSNSIYRFLRKKLDNKEFVKDAIRQKEIKKRLTFDWSEEIMRIVEDEKLNMDTI